TPQAGHSYGTAGGFTPNVVVSYSGGSATGTAQLTVWSIDYSDLINVLENELDGDTALKVTLTADPGFRVSLTSFDLGGWPHLDHTIPTLSVVETTAGTQFTESNVHIEGDSGHTSKTFATPITGQELTIVI